jgi:2-dehydro-3-deoxyphosphogluconate aldolase / (4S)-4-hydroxy-2-oxoglutarate aldolase
MNLLEELRSRRLLAIVRGTDTAAATRTVLTLAAEGVSLVEVSLTTPGAFEVISRARAELCDGGCVGGVDAEAAREYLAAGAVAVGVGSPLIGDAASGGSLSDLRRRARRFLAAVRDAPGRRQ